MFSRSIAWASCLLIGAGCGISAEPRPLPAHHPASPETSEGPYTPPPNLLSGDPPAPGPEVGGTHGHLHPDHGGHGQAKAAPKPYPLNTCLVSGDELGKMGKPEVILHEGREIKFCCAACIPTFKKDPAKYLNLLDEAAKKEKPRDEKVDPKHEHEDKK